RATAIALGIHVADPHPQRSFPTKANPSRGGDAKPRIKACRLDGRATEGRSGSALLGTRTRRRPGVFVHLRHPRRWPTRSDRRRRPPEAELRPWESAMALCPPI